ncbi:MAG TPA: dual specificity protein phosphatase family protein [Gemmataceae bacterium]|nr:dual specificity protein phosphatase family protein [Gemmataceae bacterium]
MPRPRGGDWLEDEIKAWRRARVDGVVSLLTADEVADLNLADERELCLANGIRYESFPIADRGVPSSRNDFSTLMSRLVGHLGEGKTVLVHCRQGIGRSALVAVGALVSSGTDADAAIQHVGAARGCPVPETSEQRKWILDLAKSLTAPAATALELGRPQSSTS